MYDELLIKVILQDREREIARARRLAEAEHAQDRARDRGARAKADRRQDTDLRPAERKAA